MTPDEEGFLYPGSIRPAAKIAPLPQSLPPDPLFGCDDRRLLQMEERPREKTLAEQKRLSEPSPLPADRTLFREKYRRFGFALSSPRLANKKQPLPPVIGATVVFCSGIEDQAWAVRPAYFETFATQAAKAAMKLFRNSRVPSFTRVPLASNNAAALPIYASGCGMVAMFTNTKVCRK